MNQKAGSVWLCFFIGLSIVLSLNINFTHRGFLGKPSGKAERPLKPHFIFWLEPKNEAKKFKTTPASLEKLVVCRLKTFKLASTKYVESQQKSFLRLLHSIFRLIGRGQSFAEVVKTVRCSIYKKRPWVALHGRIY